MSKMSDVSDSADRDERHEDDDVALVLVLPTRYGTIDFQAYAQTVDDAPLIAAILARLRSRHPDLDLFVGLPASERTDPLNEIFRSHRVTLLDAARQRDLDTILEAASRSGASHVALVHPEYALAPRDLLERVLAHHVAQRPACACTFVTGLAPRACPEIYSTTFLRMLSRIPATGLSRDPRVLAQALRSASQLSPASPAPAPSASAFSSTPAPSAVVDRQATLDARTLYDARPGELPPAVTFDTIDRVDMAVRLLKANPDTPDLTLLRKWRAVDDENARARHAHWPRWPGRPRQPRRPRRSQNYPVRRKLLIVSNASLYCGAQAALLNLMRHLDRDRYIPHLLVARSGLFSRAAAALDVPVFAPEREFAGATFADLACVRDPFDAVDPDLVHCDGFEGHAIYGLTKLAGRPLVQSARLLHLDPMASQLSYADHTIAVSQDVRARVVDLGVLPERVSVVYDGVELRPVDEIQRRRARAAHGIDPDVFVVGALARVERQKRLHAVAASVAAVAAATTARTDGCRRVMALIAGEHADDRYAQEIAASAPPGVVRLLGFQEDASAVLAACDCIVAAGRAEAAGMSTLEAMGSGLPVIVAADGGGRELVDHTSGLIVDIDQPGALTAAIATLAADRTLAARMGEAALTRCREHYSAKDMASHVMQVYDVVCDEGGPDRNHSSTATPPA